MSSDPERPMEKLLRDCAKERRDHAGESWELHAVNRRLLQQEVTQKYGSKPGTTRNAGTGWAGAWWVKLAGGLAAALVAAGLVWLTLPRSSQKSATLMARNDVAPATKSSDAKSKSLNEESRSPGPLLNEREVAFQPPNEKVATKKEESLDDSKRDASGKDVTAGAPLSLAEKAQQKPTSEPMIAQTIPAAPPVNSTEVSDAAAAAFRQRYGSSQGLASTTPLTAAASATDPEKQRSALAIASALPSSPMANGPALPPLASASAAAPEGQSQPIQYGDFANAAPQMGRIMRSFQQPALTPPAPSARTDSLARSSPAPILAHFRVEQLGSELRIIDSDNSVYVGQLKPADVSSTAPVLVGAQTDANSGVSASGTVRAKSASLKSSVSQALPPGFVFQVVGTNLTSHQRVVFSGVLSGVTDSSVGDPQVAQVPRFGGMAGSRSVGGVAQFSNAKNPPTPAQQNPHISGKALVGSAQPIIVEASVTQPRPSSSESK